MGKVRAPELLATILKNDKYFYEYEATTKDKAQR
jgi:hypothetical protein